MDGLQTLQRLAEGRGRCLRILLFFVALVAGTLAAPARDAAPLLEADVQPLALRSRTAAPVFVDIKLRSRQSAMLEGVLELQVMAGNELLFRQQTRELVLPPGVTTQRLLLPPMSVPPGWVLEVRLVFLMRKGSHDLGRFPLSDHTSPGRQYLIAVCSSISTLPQDRLRFWQTLRPEWIFPETTTAVRPILSMPVKIAPEDMPSAMGLCAFDVVALEGASFASLGDKQLSELSSWVEGGGSLCVAPSAPISAEHLAFLNTLASAPGRSPAVVAAPGQALSLREGTHVLRRAGLGRLVITLAPPSTEAEIAAPEWRAVLQFLAKTNHAFASNKALAGEFDSPRYLATNHALAELLPQSSAMIPLPVLAAILGAFVLLVGPGEWFILGWLRRRGWTWITFPLLAMAFAFLALRTAEFYLGRDDKRTALIVTDIDSKGRTLRENQLELRIPGSNKTAVSEMRHCLSIPTSFGRGADDEVTSAPLYQGAFPNHYNLTLSLQQWNPVVHRTMKFATGAGVPALDWHAIDFRSLVSENPESGQRLIDQLRAQGWAAQIYHLGHPVVNARPSIDSGLVVPISQLRGSDRTPGMAAYSPSGRSDLADLALHDPSDPNEWLVVAAKSSEHTLHIVRHLFRSDE